MRLVAVAALVLAADHRPLPAAAPNELVAPALAAHVIADDELEPDALRALCRPQVTLWLQTKSNVLKASTVETLNRCERAFVQLRPNVSDAARRQLERAPRVGLWVAAAHVDDPSILRLKGPRPLAVWFEGALDEGLARRLERARPGLIEWRKPIGPSVLSWGLFLALPGKKLLSVDADRSAPLVCSGPVSDRAPSVRVHVASLLALGADPYPCGAGSRVMVAPDVDRWLLQSVLVRDPSAEPEVRAVSAREASLAAALFDELQLERR